MNNNNSTLYADLLSKYKIRNDSYQIDELISEKSLMKILFSDFVKNSESTENSKRFATYILSQNTINHIDSFIYKDELYEENFKLVDKTYIPYQSGLLLEKKNIYNNEITSSAEVKVNNIGFEDYNSTYSGYFYTNNLSGDFTFYLTSGSDISLIINNEKIIEDDGSSNEISGVITLQKDTYYPIQINHKMRGSIYFQFSHDYLPKLLDGIDHFYHKTTKATYDEKTSLPTSNSNIIDYDISSYASENIKAYLFYLDFIKEIYRNANDLKKQNKSHIVENMTIRARYIHADIGILLYIRKSYYNITLNITRKSTSNDIDDISISSDKSVLSIFSKFKADIIRHLNYLNGDDIKLSDEMFSNAIINFYATCRLKLMYCISNSLLIVSKQNSDINNIIDSKIKSITIPIFINYKDNVNKFEEGNLRNKYLNYSNKVMEAKYNIGKSNDTIAKSHDILKKNKGLSNISKEKLKNANNMKYFAISLLSIVVICILIMNTNNVDNVIKVLVLFGLALFVIYISVFFVQNTTEEFTNGDLKTVVIRSNTIQPHGIVARWISYAFNKIQLPKDYYDKCLISWDVKLSVYKGYSVYGGGYGSLWMDMGGFPLPYVKHNDNRTHVRTYNNRKDNLVRNSTKTLHPSASIWSYPNWSNLYFELTIRYDLKKCREAEANEKKIREEQLKKMMEIQELNRKIAEIFLKEKEAQIELEKAQQDFKNIQNEIKTLENEFNKLSHELDSKIKTQKQEYIKLKKKLAEQNAVIAKQEVKIREINFRIENKKADVAREEVRLENETKLKNTSISNTNDRLESLRKKALTDFNDFISINKKVELALISYLNAKNAFEIIKEGLNKANKDVSKDIDAAHAKYILDRAILEGKTLAEEQEIIRLQTVRSSVELSNYKKKIVADGLKEANKNLSISIEKETERYNQAKISERNAILQKELAEKYSEELLSEMNEKYDNDSKDVESFIRFLEVKIANEREQKAQLDKETAMIRLNELGNIAAEQSAKTMTKINDKLINDTNKNIDVYNNFLNQNRKNLSEVRSKKRDLENKLAMAISSKNTTQETVEERNKDLEVRKQIEINELKEEKLVLMMEHAEIAKKNELESLKSLNEKDIKQKLQEQINKAKNDLQNVLIDIDHYDDIVDNVEVSSIFDDIDSSILNNSKLSINTTHNDIILTKLEQEKQKYFKHSIKSENNVKTSDKDINVNNVTTNEVVSLNLCIVGITLSLLIGMTFHYLGYTSLGIITFIGIFIASIIYYLIDKTSITRLNARHNYWGAPSSVNKLH